MCGGIEMSGRKSSEVNALLARGLMARESGNQNYHGSINSSGDTIRKNQAVINRINKKIDNEEIDISNESKSEFPNESKELQDKFDSIKKSNVKIDYSKDIKKLDDEKEEIDNNLRNADNEQKRISNIIRHKHDYCNQEYRDADFLVNVYNKIGQAKNTIVNKFKSLVQKSNKDVIKYKNLENDMDNVIKAGKELNEKSIRIVELREKASESKKYISEMFERIDEDNAIKFCEKDYDVLKNEMISFDKMNDEQVIENVSMISEKISVFSYKVDKLYSEYKEKYDKIEAGIKLNESSLSTSASFYYEPVDYFKNKDNSTKISVLDYLSEYSDKIELIDAINTSMDKSKKLLEEEKFEEAEKIIQECSDNISKANEYAVLLQEHMITNFYTTKDMVNVFKKMGFSTGAYKIDGHIKNGWRISASNPNGENIDFTKVFIDDNGKMNLNIDHKTMGDCPSKWTDIVAELDNVGIHIETIKMENGEVVVDKRGSRTEDITEDSQVQVRERK